MKRIFVGAVMALCPAVIFVPAYLASGPQLDAPRLAQFFKLYEENRYVEAIAVLPSRFIEMSLYEKGRETLPPYKRDEPIYFDIQAKASGAKARPKQDPYEKEILYYLGVMSYRMGDLERARQTLLLCLQLDPTYRMAHVYLFRVYAKLEADLLSQCGDSAPGTGRLLIDKLGFGSSELHLDEAVELESSGKRSGPRAVLLTFLYDKPLIKNTAYRFSPDPSPKARQFFFSAISDPGLGRVELVTKERHCLDEVVFAVEQVLYFDGLDASGKMAGGRQILTRFDVALELLMPRPADKAVVYDPAGAKIQDIPISK
jgi:tetratricopeptide (TPR) repeat protein